MRTIDELPEIDPFSPEHLADPLASFERARESSWAARSMRGVEVLTYECDALAHLRAAPAAVVLPSTAAEVQAIVRLCVQEGVPFVPRGHGTGLSGGALPVAGGIVIALSRLNRVLDVDIPNRRVTVEPGVTNLEITRQVAPYGYYYAPDPSSQQVCTIGGNVAETSGGAHCLKNGFTVTHVTGLTVVLPEGDRLELGGKALDPEGPDLLGVFVGSEGTLGIATEVTLRVLRKPEGPRTADTGRQDACGTDVQAGCPARRTDLWYGAAGLILAGLAGFRHRDLQGTA